VPARRPVRSREPAKAGMTAKAAPVAGEGERAGAAGQARAVAVSGARVRGVEHPGEEPGAQAGDLGEDRAGGRPGCWADRAADGPARIRRARSWAPRVPGLCACGQPWALLK
jgi:hypothetical protein